MMLLSQLAEIKESSYVTPQICYKEGKEEMANEVENQEENEYEAISLYAEMN